jgi:protein-tyrosine phosphatase
MGTLDFPGAEQRQPENFALRFPEIGGALNLRDMGGYPAADGRRTRWNVLYRSGTTHAMTAAEVQRLMPYGVRCAYDLRSNTERHEHPSALSRLPGIDYQFVDHDALPGDIKRLFANPDCRPEHSKSMMMSAYRKIPFEFRSSFRTLFTHLENGNLPLIFNCTAGKDRTGVAAALILTAVGVPQELVVEDYLLSERSFDRSCEILLEGSLATIFTETNRDIWEPVMRVDADYLRAAFDEIDRSCGSVTRYLAEELNLSELGRERIRINLLE